MQLRLYLASPQKFDEAIEFGFPSVLTEPRVLARPMTSPAHTPDAHCTFFHDDTPDLSEDEGDDDDDDDDDREQDTSYNPRTPDEPVFPPRRSPRKSSVDNFSRPRALSMRTRGTDAYSRYGVSEREMTLHMTLTRPDLRTPEEPLPFTDRKPHINSLPLEKFDFSTSVSPVSIWDTLPAVEESRMKRFWRKLRLR
jgi:hypothetical protein